MGGRQAAHSAGGSQGGAHAGQVPPAGRHAKQEAAVAFCLACLSTGTVRLYSQRSGFNSRKGLPYIPFLGCAVVGW